MSPQYEWLRQRIMDFVRQNPGCSGREIARHTGTSSPDLWQRFQELQDIGQLRKEGRTNQTKWFPGEFA